MFIKDPHNLHCVELAQAWLIKSGFNIVIGIELSQQLLRLAEIEKKQGKIVNPDKLQHTTDILKGLKIMKRHGL